MSIVKSLISKLSVMIVPATFFSISYYLEVSLKNCNDVDLNVYMHLSKMLLADGNRRHFLGLKREKYFLYYLVEAY